MSAGKLPTIRPQIDMHPNNKGKRILIPHLSQSCQDFEQVIFFPGSQQPFALDTSLASLLLLEQIQGNMSENSEVLRSAVLSYPAAVFVKSDVERPMQLILDAPMRAYRPQEAFGSRDTGDMIAVFTTVLFTRQTLRPDAGDGGQVLPVLKAAQVA